MPENTSTTFSVGYKGALEDLKRILAVSDKVKTVYTGGVAATIGGGRPQYAVSLQSLAEQVDWAHTHGASFEVAINTPAKPSDCPEARWREGAKTTLQDLERIGVDGVIVAHPIIMEQVKLHTGMRLIVSTICEVATARSALRYESIGGDVIIPSMNANMRMGELELMRRSLKKAKLRIMLNEMCMGDCPWRRNHFVETSWQGSRHGITDDFYYINCSRLYLKEPYLLVANNTIRPEDLWRYRPITGEFKILGRNALIEDLLIRIQAYDKERFDGNYVTLIWSDLARTINIPNRLLDGLIEKKLTCSKVCDSCHLCEQRIASLAAT